ncbi:MAG: hypothetical protein RMJ35_06600, partial [Phycisphaerales bacterium]|nr:hypothetical protein [Phycisphaerales bacterium]
SIRSDQAEGLAVEGTARAVQLLFEPAAADARGAGPLTARQIRQVMLLGNVRFDGLRYEPSGALVQRMHLFCEKLGYRPSDGQITVPVGGRMLLEDRRPTPTAEVGSVATPRGATAFRWSDGLQYDPQKLEARMSGNVLVVHRPTDTSARDLRLNADLVTAELLAPSDARAVAVGDPSTAQLKRVTARGQVRFNSDRLEFLASEVELRPRDDLLIARGTPGSPAVLMDPEGLSRGSFAELWLNIRTQESHLKDFRASIRR